MINFVSLGDSPPSPLALYTVTSGGSVTLHRESYTEEEIQYMRDSFEGDPKRFRNALEAELHKLNNRPSCEMEEMEQLKEALDILKGFADNWNGFGAKAANPKSISKAFKFLKLLPAEYALPSKVSLDDGDVVMSWEPYCTAVIIEPNLIHSYRSFAGYVDDEKFGEDKIPETVLFHLPLKS